MQNAGHQFGPGAAGSHQPQSFATEAPPSGGSTTSSLRQFRKKDVDKQAVSNDQQPTTAVSENSRHVATVAPHNHYPPRTNDFYPRYHPTQFPDYSSSLPYKEPSQVKYSEIAEASPLQHVDHHMSNVIPKPKEKEYMEMCNVPQSHMKQTYPDHHRQQTYPPDPSVHAHAQYLHKDHPQVHPSYRHESQYIPKEYQYQQLTQIPPKYNMPSQVRKYPPQDNDFLAKLQKLHPIMAKSIMTDHHIRESQPSYPAMNQSRMYDQNQRYYPTSFQTHSYPHNYPMSHYNYPQSCSYPRSSQMNSMPRFAHTERSISPRRTYTESMGLSLNYTSVPQKVSPTYPQYNAPEYSQHYQHRRTTDYYPQAPRPTQYIPQSHEISHEINETRGVTVSNNLRDFIENWADEEPGPEANQIDQSGKYMYKDNLRPREDSAETIFMLPAALQYLESGNVVPENGIPFVTETGHQYILKNGGPLDGTVKVIDNKETTENGERVVNLQIPDPIKPDCMLANKQNLQIQKRQESPLSNDPNQKVVIHSNTLIKPPNFPEPNSFNGLSPEFLHNHMKNNSSIIQQNSAPKIAEPEKRSETYQDQYYSFVQPLNNIPKIVEKVDKNCSPINGELINASTSVIKPNIHHLEEIKTNTEKFHSSTSKYEEIPDSDLHFASREERKEILEQPQSNEDLSIPNTEENVEIPLEKTDDLTLLDPKIEMKHMPIIDAAHEENNDTATYYSTEKEENEEVINEFKDKAQGEVIEKRALKIEDADNKTEERNITTEDLEKRSNEMMINPTEDDAKEQESFEASHDTTELLDELENHFEENGDCQRPPSISEDFENDVEDTNLEEHIADALRDIPPQSHDEESTKNLDESLNIIEEKEDSKGNVCEDEELLDLSQSRKEDKVEETTLVLKENVVISSEDIDGKLEESHNILTTEESTEHLDSNEKVSSENTSELGSKHEESDFISDKEQSKSEELNENEEISESSLVKKHELCMDNIKYNATASPEYGNSENNEEIVNFKETQNEEILSPDLLKEDLQENTKMDVIESSEIIEKKTEQMTGLGKVNEETSMKMCEEIDEETSKTEEENSAYSLENTVLEDVGNEDGPFDDQNNSRDAYSSPNEKSSQKEDKLNDDRTASNSFDSSEDRNVDLKSSQKEDTASNSFDSSEDTNVDLKLSLKEDKLNDDQTASNSFDSSEDTNVDLKDPLIETIPVSTGDKNISSEEKFPVNEETETKIIEEPKRKPVIKHKRTQRIFSVDDIINNIGNYKAKEVPYRRQSLDTAKSFLENEIRYENILREDYLKDIERFKESVASSQRETLKKDEDKLSLDKELISEEIVLKSEDLSTCEDVFEAQMKDFNVEKSKDHPTCEDNPEPEIKESENISKFEYESTSEVFPEVKEFENISKSEDQSTSEVSPEAEIKESENIFKSEDQRTCEDISADQSTSEVSPEAEIKESENIFKSEDQPTCEDISETKIKESGSISTFEEIRDTEKEDTQTNFSEIIGGISAKDGDSENNSSLVNKEKQNLSLHEEIPMEVSPAEENITKEIKIEETLEEKIVNEDTVESKDKKGGNVLEEKQMNIAVVEEDNNEENENNDKEIEETNFYDSKNDEAIDSLKDIETTKDHKQQSPEVTVQEHSKIEESEEQSSENLLESKCEAVETTTNDSKTIETAAMTLTSVVLKNEEKTVEELVDCNSIDKPNHESDSSQPYSLIEQVVSPNGEVQYRSAIKIEENNVLLHIGGELVEINVSTVNGKKVITVVPLSDSTVVDFNDNYEEPATDPLALDDTIEEEKPEEKEGDLELRVIKEITPPGTVLEDSIIDQNEIIIGDEGLEEEIELDLKNYAPKNEEMPIMLCTKAAMKAYDDVKPLNQIKARKNEERSVKKLVRKPASSTSRDYKTKSGTGKIKEAKRTSSTTNEDPVPVKRSRRLSEKKTEGEKKCEQKQALKELVKARNLKKTKMMQKNEAADDSDEYVDFKELVRARKLKKSKLLERKKREEIKLKSIPVIEDECLVDSTTDILNIAVTKEDLMEMGDIDSNTGDIDVKTNIEDETTKNKSEIFEGIKRILPEKEVKKEDKINNNVDKRVVIPKPSIPKEKKIKKPQKIAGNVKKIGETPKDNIKDSPVKIVESTIPEKDNNVQDSVIDSPKIVKKNGSKEKEEPDKEGEIVEQKAKEHVAKKVTFSSVGSTIPEVSSDSKADTKVKINSCSTDVPLKMDIKPISNRDPRKKLLKTTVIVPSVSELLEEKDSVDTTVKKKLSLEEYNKRKRKASSDSEKDSRSTANKAQVVPSEKTESTPKKMNDVTKLQRAKSLEDIKPVVGNGLPRRKLSLNEDTSTSRQLFDWEETQSPKTNSQNHRKPELCPTEFRGLLSSKQKSVIDLSDLDVTPKSSETISISSEDDTLQVYKNQVDTKLSTLNIQIPKVWKTTKSSYSYEREVPKVSFSSREISECHVLMRRFLNKEHLSRDEMFKIKQIIYYKRVMQHMKRNKHSELNPLQLSPSYSVKKPREEDEEDINVHLRKSSEDRRKKRRFRNPHADSSSSDDSGSDCSDKEKPSGDYSVVQTNSIDAGVPKLIIKRKPELPQPFVRLERLDLSPFLKKRKYF